MKIPKPNKTIIAVSIAVLVIAVAGVTAVSLREKQPFPEKALKNNITVFAPEKIEGYSVVKETVKYNEQDKVLFYDVQTPHGRLAMAAQPTPEAFHDSAEVYPQLLNKMHQYKDLETSIGRVTLTMPEELKGQQSAVAHLRGTLIFAKPSANISDAQWQEVFNNFVSVN